LLATLNHVVALGAANERANSSSTLSISKKSSTNSPSILLRSLECITLWSSKCKNIELFGSDKNKFVKNKLNLYFELNE
jgi:hypothetical protein